MNKIKSIINHIQNIQNGFLEIQKAADEIIDCQTLQESFKLSKQLLSSEKFQVRSLAVFILGRLAGSLNESLKILKENVSRDDNWRVQEILAKTFDRFCSDIGYENALPIIKEWLADNHPNVRRAVTEGLRIWTGRPYFKENPEVAVQLLSHLKNDESEYVRKSVGNALRDISKKHGLLVKNELNTWDISKKQIKQTYKLAVKFLEKTKK